MTKIGLQVFSKRSLLGLILIITAVIVLDSTLIKYVTYTNRELSTSLKLGIFLLFFIIFGLTNLISLRFIWEKRGGSIPKGVLRYFRILVSACQSIIVALVASIIIQMIILHNYNILTLLGSVYVSHFFSVVFLVSLVIVLARWFRYQRNYALLIYAISFSLISMNILGSAIYFTTQLPYHMLLKKPYPIHLYVVNLPRSELATDFGAMLDVLSFLSFVLTWVATAKLLSQYRNRIGRIKYLTLIGVPLIYFLFPFETYFANFTHQIILIFPILFSVIYIILFSATKQVGGILFGMVFITASDFINRPRVRISVLATSIGIVIIFSSVEIDSVLYAVYPPFGLITVSFMPLGSYLLFVGIFTSARSVAEDASLRKDFYKKAENQLDLLNSIGLIEMEKELLNRYKPVLNRSKILQNEEYQEPEQSDIKEIIRDVLQELQSKKNNETKENNM